MERKKKEGDNLLQLRAYSPLPLGAAEDAGEKQSQHHVEQYHAVLRIGAGSALRVSQLYTATLLGGGHEMLCTPPATPPGLAGKWQTEMRDQNAAVALCW